MLDEFVARENSRDNFDAIRSRTLPITPNIARTIARSNRKIVASPRDSLDRRTLLSIATFNGDIVVASARMTSLPIATTSSR